MLIGIGHFIASLPGSFLTLHLLYLEYGKAVESWVGPDNEAGWGPEKVVGGFTYYYFV